MEQQKSGQANPSGSVQWVYSLSFILSLAIFAAGIYLAYSQKQYVLLATGAACVIGVLITWPISISLAEAKKASCDQFEQLVNPLNERMEQLSIMLNLISEQQLLSDRAKAVAFREKDRDALRRAIQEELARHDYEAAASLADEMEKGFGYRQEAQRLRVQINEKKNEAHRKQITEATGTLERHIRAERWQEAHHEADRLIALYPDSEHVRHLPAEINSKREQHKQQLIESLREADVRQDADGGVEILKKLDTYLSPAEAEGMQELARRIFKHKLENVRTQFALAVQEHNWAKAIRLGNVIIEEFPNTQMAKEVKESMPSLQQRAAGLAATAV